MTTFSDDDQHPLLACDFTHADLLGLRHIVAGHAALAGLAGMRWDDFVLAVHEGAVNAVDHGGGSGRVRLWRSGPLLCCQISDDGPGLPSCLRCRRQRWLLPDRDGIGGRGLWMISQLADDVVITSGAQGTVVRIAFRLPDRTDPPR